MQCPSLNSSKSTSVKYVEILKIKDYRQWGLRVGRGGVCGKQPCRTRMLSHSSADTISTSMLISVESSVLELNHNRLGLCTCCESSKKIVYLF